jgi:hypothetical protein
MSCVHTRCGTHKHSTALLSAWCVLQQQADCCVLPTRAGLRRTPQQDKRLTAAQLLAHPWLQTPLTAEHQAAWDELQQEQQAVTQLLTEKRDPHVVRACVCSALCVPCVCRTRCSWLTRARVGLNRVLLGVLCLCVADPPSQAGDAGHAGYFQQATLQALAVSARRPQRSCQRRRILADTGGRSSSSARCGAAATSSSSSSSLGSMGACHTDASP